MWLQIKMNLVRRSWMIFGKFIPTRLQTNDVYFFHNSHQFLSLLLIIKIITSSIFSNKQDFFACWYKVTIVRLIKKYVPFSISLDYICQSISLSKKHPLKQKGKKIKHKTATLIAVIIKSKSYFYDTNSSEKLFSSIHPEKKDKPLNILQVTWFLTRFDNHTWMHICSTFITKKGRDWTRASKAEKINKKK